MGLFTRKKIEDIKSVDELFIALTKRKYWRRIPSGILRQIVDNANGDVEKVQKFCFVSEFHNCVRNNFIPLLKNSADPEMTLALFSVTLERLAAQAAQQVPRFPNGSRERETAIRTAETAYMSSLLCYPFMLPSYGGLAWFYVMIGSIDRAAEICRDYDAVERNLLSSNDADLGVYNQSMKSDASQVRRVIDHLRAEVGIE